MNLTHEQVQRLTGDADRWADALNNAIQRWNIGTPERLAMFLAQCAHESGGFKHLVENLRYSKEALVKTWPTRFTAADAARMEYDERAIAERAYGGRLGNAMEGLGDGYRFRGRGIIQLTGRDNYTRCGQAIGLDLAAHPEMLEQPLWAAISAGWFWATNGCNELADAGDYLAVTKRINGGTNGLQDRETWLATVRSILGPARPGGAPTPTPQPPVKAGQPNQREGARTMDPFSLAAIGKIIGMIPSLAGVLGGEKAQERAQAAQVVLDAFTGGVPGAVNAQDAVQKAEADPAVRAAAVAAVESNPAVMSLVEVGGGVVAARKANADYIAGIEDDEWWRMILKVLANPAMLISAAGLYLVYRFVPALADQVVKLSPEVVASLITSIVVGTLGAIFGFWLGQTWQQKRKDEQ